MPQPTQMPPKKKQVSARTQSHGAKYAMRHGYTPGSNPRRRGGRWVGKHGKDSR